MSAPDWDTLITTAMASRPQPRTAITHAGGFTSATRPQKFICDNGELYVVKFKENMHGDGRGLFTEQVVAIAGRLIGAPVADVELVEVAHPLRGVSVPATGHRNWRR